MKPFFKIAAQAAAVAVLIAVAMATFIVLIKV